MSAIFISYTGRDPEGDAWADQLTEWFQEWEYGYFRDKDHSHGVKAGDDWRQTLYRELGEATAMVCLCSKQYDSSPWCVGEVAIAVENGKIVIPIQLAHSAEELKSEPLPLLLQTKQAIKVPDSANPSPEQLAEVRQRLQAKLREKLNWRDLQHWDSNLAPYPGLPAFEEQQAPVFFGRDEAIEAVVERMGALALRPRAFLLLLGASGYGKSSLVRAGVVPRLKGDRERSWTVLPPFTPGDEPFKELEEAVLDAGAVFDASDPLSSLQELQRQSKSRVVVVIDQFEELLSAGPKEDGKVDEGETFQKFLQKLLSSRKAGLMVLATMRTDFLAPLQTRWPALTGMAKSFTLEPIEPEDFGDLITGPADRSKLTLEPGLEERLVKESGGRDALPLLAFTLEKLWKARKKQGVAVAGTRPGEQWDLTVKDYEVLGGVDGAVSTRAKECWDPQTSSDKELAALREAFLDHLVSVSGDGREAKRAARLNDLPHACRQIVQRMVDDRLLVLKEGTVEIAHEALLRTWEPLVEWIEAGKVELLQCLRVKRLAEDLKAGAPVRQRRQALEQLAALAAAGGSEERAVRKEARETLEHLLSDGSYPLADRQDAALMLALIGAEEPLRQLLADGKTPVGLRRRAAECLGLMAQRSTDSDQRHRIKEELERWLRSEPLEVRIEVELDPKELDPVKVQALVEQAQGQLAEALQQAIQSGQLPPDLGEEQLREMFQQAVSQMVDEQLRQQLWAEGRAPGWAVHDAHLPLLQGAALGLQLAASADLPLLGSGPGLVVPMLTLMTTEEEGGLQIRTEVVEVPVWKLPLPPSEPLARGEHLELVMVPPDTITIGSPAEEDGRDVYRQLRLKCDEDEKVDVEARRPVRLSTFAMVRHPISQGQWRAVVEGVASQERDLEAEPGKANPESLWDQHGQPGELAVDSVSWNDGQEWLLRLNFWLVEHWRELGGNGEAPQLALPSESQWEAACRGCEPDEESTPFHFGVTLDASWERYDASSTFGLGRRGAKVKQPGVNGAHGLVNRLGLAELHGQVLEWCGDQWHRDPAAGAPLDGSAIEGPDPDLRGTSEEFFRLLRGGSWFNDPRYCRAACRSSNRPGVESTCVGLRPCCPSPPGSLLGS